MSLPYEESLSTVKHWQNPQHQQQHQQSGSSRQQNHSTSRPGTGGSATSQRDASRSPSQNGRNNQQQTTVSTRIISPRGGTRLIIPLRTQPVKVPPPPHAPPPRPPPKPSISPAAQKAQPKYLHGLDRIAETGSQRRERIDAERRERAKSTQSQSAAQWKSCANPQPFFASSQKDPSDIQNRMAKPLVLPEEEREKIVERLAKVPPPRPPLPPIVPKWSMSEEEEAAMIERLSEPFERREPTPVERHVLDDEELDEMVQRLYQAPLDRKAELREQRGW